MEKRMNQISETIMDQLVRGILTALSENVIQIILYGSAARGDNQADSDIDIAVILRHPMTSDEEDRLSDFIVDMNLEYDTVFSVIDIEEDYYSKWKSVLPFYRNVSREGISLWKAA